MIGLTLARRYARAFLEIGLNEKNSEILERDLKLFAELLRESKELRNILFSSIYSAAVRQGIAQRLSESLKLTKRTQEFIELLIERDRINYFFEIVKSYESLHDEILNRQRATLMTPLELPEESLKAIAQKLEMMTGKKILLFVEKEPALIGGVLVKIGNTIYDGTLINQLQKIKKILYKE